MRNHNLGNLPNVQKGTTIFTHDCYTPAAGTVLSDYTVFAPASNKASYERGRTFQNLEQTFRNNDLFLTHLGIEDQIRLAFTGETEDASALTDLTVGSDDNSWEGYQLAQLYNFTRVVITANGNEIINLPYHEVVGKRVVNVGTRYEMKVADRQSHLYPLPQAIPVPDGGNIDIQLQFPAGLTLKAAADGADTLFGTADVYAWKFDMKLESTKPLSV